ncbi:MAG: IS701 family transposase [Thermoplasmata archaeon]|nr:IS701 family transposase [Thermoplasmata archaeon]
MPGLSEPEERRFDGYLEQLSLAVGHEDRRDPLRTYLVGLCLPGERKSIEPIAARVDPRHVSARHQSLHHFVALAPWDDRALLRIADRAVLDQMDRHGGVMAWSVDDTGIPKKGTHSVGVTRQYSGNLGKQDNCQVAVSISLVNEAVSVPSAYCPYLPEEWARDRARRKTVGVPAEIRFRTKGQIALEQIDALRAEGLPEAPVVADAGYGTSHEFREGLTARGLAYVVGIQSTATLWPPGKTPLAPAPYRGNGRPSVRLRRNAEHRPLDALALARSLPKQEWEEVAWREGTKGLLSSRFARVPVRVAHRDYNRRSPRPVEWLLIEWPEGEEAPTKYWLSTLPADTPTEMLVRWAKARWRIERDYEELKQEFGLDQFEGRGWRGFHHHATLCIAAYGFLAAERARHSPPRPLAFLQIPRLPASYRPRGTPGSS